MTPPSVTGSVYHMWFLRGIAMIVLCAFGMALGVTSAHSHDEHHHDHHDQHTVGVVLEANDDHQDQDCALCHLTVPPGMLTTMYTTCQYYSCTELQQPVVRCYIDQRCTRDVRGRAPPAV
ncbi:MAG: hypothetical protein MUC47_06175 [Candidatus Kapabacteria bacterium]|nr:hypothetical protein [Candidatus Kapabacteria bacterium]